MMKNIVSYSVELKEKYKCFYETISMFRGAVKFLIPIVAHEFSAINELNLNEQFSFVSKLLKSSSKSNGYIDRSFESLLYDYKVSAVNQAVRIVKKYRKALALWNLSDKSTDPPLLKVNNHAMPNFYKSGYVFKLIKDEDSYKCVIKLLVCGKWEWEEFNFCKSDLSYLEKIGLKLESANSPVLEKKGKHFALRFSFDRFFSVTNRKKRILACDIGINNAAVVCVMEEDGTIVARKFIKFKTEEARLRSILSEIKIAHEVTNCKTPRLYRLAVNYNSELAKLTATAIVNTAADHQCDVVVMEKLSEKRSKHFGQNAMRLAIWRKNDVINRVQDLAHYKGMKFSTVLAQNTSKLAFDGSGEVKRDENNYSLCTFKSGKKYNCDLNSSYNIGARYFVREIWKTFPEKNITAIKAKVPELWCGAHCTLSTLIDLYAVKDTLVPRAEWKLYW